MSPAVVVLVAIGVAVAVLSWKAGEGGQAEDAAALRRTLSRLSAVPVSSPALVLPTWRLTRAERGERALTVARQVARRGNVAVIRRDLGAMIEYPPSWAGDLPPNLRAVPEGV